MLRWSPSLRMADGGQLSDFIDGLGPGQLVGRQVLGAPALGDIQLSLCHQKGCLEVEVIRARGLQVSSGFLYLFIAELTYPCLPVTPELKSLTGSVCEGVPGFGQEMHCQVQNDNCSQDLGPLISTTVGLSRELRRVHITSECHLSLNFLI